MSKRTIAGMQKLFEQAAEIAKKVPENMQETAFNRALDFLVGANNVPNQQTEKKTEQINPANLIEKPKNEESLDVLLRSIDSTKYPYMRETTKVLDRSLFVLQIALNDHNVDGLTPVEIALILTEKFRLSTTRQAVGMAFKNAPNLVDRVAEGRAYRYRIMGPGENYLADLQNIGTGEQTLQQKKRPQKRKTRGRQAKKRTSKKSETSAAKKLNSGVKTTSKKKSKGRRVDKLGPKAAITELVNSGYFKIGKTGPEVQEHLKKKRGFDLGTDQLRMAMLRLVRDGLLERDENEEGQYEYKQP